MPLRNIFPWLTVILAGGRIQAMDFHSPVRNGLADFSAAPLTEAVALAGEWQIFAGRLLNGEPGTSTHELIAVPGAWRDMRPDIFPANQSFGTYRLQLKFHPAERGKLLALRLPEIASAYRLFFSGRELAAVGEVGTSAHEARGDYRRILVPLKVESEQAELLLQVSNFDEANVGGLWKAPVLGPLELLVRERENALVADSVALGIFFIFGIYHLALFFLRRDETSTLAFGFFCLIIALRTGLTGEKLFHAWNFLPFVWRLRLEYATLFAGALTCSWYLKSLYPRHFPRWVWYAIVAVTAVFASITFFTPPTFFGNMLRSVQVFLLCVGGALAYSVGVALWQRETGAHIVLVGFLILLATTLHDIIASHGLGERSFRLPVGMLLFIFAQSLLISLLFARAYQHSQALTQKLREANTVFRKFVPTDALKILRKDEIYGIQVGEQIEQNMSVMFADIRNFTALSEKMTPQENFNFLNSYLKRVGPVIRHNNGFIDKYLGDGILALFPGSAADAAQAALDIIAEVRRYNADREVAHYPALSVGVGLHYGTVMLGTLGEAERIDVTVIADAVNQAARIQELCRILKTPVLLTEVMFQQLPALSDDEYRILGEAQLKGRQAKTTIFELLAGRPEDLMEQMKLSKAVFERGVFFYLERDFAKALRYFAKSLELCPGDYVAQFYFDRCQKRLEHAESALDLDLGTAIV